MALFSIAKMLLFLMLDADTVFTIRIQNDNLPVSLDRHELLNIELKEPVQTSVCNEVQPHYM